MFGFFPETPAPKTPLAEYRILSPSASVRVSPLCLGTMNLGNQWAGLGSKMTTEDAFAFLDTFYDAGGNFIDTANSYQGESSVCQLRRPGWRGSRLDVRCSLKFAGDRHVFVQADAQLSSRSS